MKYTLAFAVPLLIMGLGSSARADTLYTTFLPPGNTYDSSSGYDVSGSASGDIADAMPFTLASTAVLTSLDLAFGFENDGADSFEVSIVTDNSNSPGTTVLESWSFAPPITPTIDSLTSVLSPTLVGGTQYWVVVTAGPDSNANTLGIWYLASEDADAFGVTRAYSSDGGSTWTVAPGYPMAFDIQGNASSTPEIPSIVMLAAGGVLLASFKVRRKGSMHSRFGRRNRVPYHDNSVIPGQVGQAPRPANGVLLVPLLRKCLAC